ncbi:glutathione S-transferase family protein [Hylemonella gracilis]|uniref:Glutathione S-transferase n=1 Tax=Hylemonella gracilis ATCC 19624 TaxID=887062 RepID=F3KQ87_9BURK|nr:glutathione S-transferase family protein [Hylemonella gracilis]EGI78054.1 glutathione S-transferase [Hylemonella gracilis ATCC 19624]
MSIVLYHHPYSRAANTLWMLEETGVPYDLRHVDILKGAQKAPDILALNPMGKLPILVDGSVVVTESAAIGLYLADRYAAGRLAPALDDPDRATYLRWSFFAPSVIEPGAMARASGWSFRPGAAGFGTYEEMLSTMEAALAHGPCLLGDRFTMADVIFGGTLRYMLQFNMLEPRSVFTDYVQGLNERPAYQRANAKNTDIARELGLGR